MSRAAARNVSQIGLNLKAETRRHARDEFLLRNLESYNTHRYIITVRGSD